MKDDSFRFISQNGSDMFSKMSMKDLTKLKDELINYEIMYRFHIGIMPGNTFGIEIEYMNGFINNFPERNDISNDIYCLIKEGIWEVEEDEDDDNDEDEEETNKKKKKKKGPIKEIDMNLNPVTENINSQKNS